MKIFTAFILLFLISGFSGVRASEGYDDLVKLVSSHATEEVIIAYINSAEFSYNLTPDEIVSLKDLGAAPHVIATAIQHKKPETAAAPREAVPEQPVVMYRPAPRYPDRWTLNELRRRKAAENLTNAVQFDFAGLAYNTATLNYEHLFGHQHGLVLEGSYGSDWGSHGEKAELSYRWHWAKSMHSGFIGIFANASRFYGQTGDQGWDMMYYYGNSIEYKKTSVSVGPVIGKRWVLMPGLSLVGRIGYGYTWSKIDWLGNTPAPDQLPPDWQLFNSGLDAELSLGFAL
jgi:hypothetical protein